MRMTVIALCLVTLAPQMPANDKLNLYRCKFTTIAPTIDGSGEDKVWNLAEWTPDFVDVTTGGKAALRTQAKLLWDDNNLYVLAKLQEPNVRGNRTEHDDKLYLENAFEVFLDP